MNCKDFHELIDSYLSDELLTETNHGVLGHLERCAHCRRLTEERRIFRERLRSAVRNCPEFKISEKFDRQLHRSLRQAALPQRRVKSSFWNLNTSLTAAAAGLVLVLTVGFLIFWNIDRAGNPTADFTEKQAESYQLIALGDHKLCAVEHALADVPAEIDLSQPEFAILKAAIQMPLKDKFGRCELVAAHTCRYQGREFTHLIFSPEGKTMSVLIMDMTEMRGFESDTIDRLSIEGFQIAHFSVDRKAVFVISDLPEQKNFAAAEIVETPLRRQLSQISKTRMISDFGLRVLDFPFSVRLTRISKPEYRSPGLNQSS